MSLFLFEVYAQSFNNPQNYADANMALRNVWLIMGFGFVIFFTLCYMRMRSLVIALRYSAWLFVASAAIFGAVAYNSSSSLTTQSQADTSAEPKNLEITYNPPTATVTWQTDKSVVEYIIYQNDRHNDVIAFDEQQLTPTRNHKVTITGLQSQVNYPFRIKYAVQEFATADGKKLFIKLP